MRSGLVALLVATSVVFVPTAFADPDKVAEAKAELERIREEASSLDAEIIEVAARADEATARLADLNEDLSAQEQKVARMGADLGDVAMLQLNGGGLDVTSQLLTSGSDSTFLSGLATIQNEMDRSNSDLQALQLEQGRLDSLRDQQVATTEAIEADRAEKERLAQEFDTKETEAENVYKRLNAEEQERLRKLEEQRQREQEERDRREQERAASRALDNQNDTASPSPEAPEKEKEQPKAPPASGRGGSAVEVALAQVGKSYVWGTSGPNTFDCSGLTSYAYRQQGISLPRSARQQYQIGTPVAKGDLQPGDLVFYYGGISHVGMYIGDGKIVHAANPRSGINVTGLNSMPYQGARRVG
ncbi:C40 family peptidase [Arachnia propionica]|nr:C40 family peptidase [Arachnia propionica]MDO5082042.1 NlpC/P60 family protein [Arachnia propionica]